MLTLNLNSAVEQELDELARLQNKPLEQLLKDMIFECLEDIHDAALGDAAMDELARGEDKVISFEEWEHQFNDMEN